MKRLLKTKYPVLIALCILVLPTLQNCERDDICAEGTATTPRLLIEFYDAESTDDLKNVPRLTAYGEDLIVDENGMVIEPTDETDTEFLIAYNTNINSIELPLIIGADGELTTTRFVLEKDTNLRLDNVFPETSNTDIIEISYTPEFVYVSRACGYKSIFNDLDVNEDADGDTWISSIEIVETTVENENTVHVRIFH